MLPANLEEMERSHLSALVREGAIETVSLDFKEEIDLSTEHGKDELAADVSAFANSVGGDLLIGVSERENGEKKGHATAAEGVELENADPFLLRIQGILQERIEPRIQGVRIQPVQVSPGHYVIAIRVPRSWQLHAVRRNRAYAVYARNANGKYPLDFSQIRDAFVLGANASERAMAWRAERIARIAAGDAPRPLVARPKVVLHVIPISAFSGRGRSKLDLAKLAGGIKAIGASAANSTYNVDGLLKYDISPEGSDEYVQVYRDGRIEALSAGLSRKGENVYFTAAVAPLIIEAVAKYGDMLRHVGLAGPTLVALAIVDGKGVAIKTREVGLSPIDRDVALLPEVDLPEIPVDKQEIASLLRPLLDAFFQSGGHAQSPGFAPDGTFRDLTGD